MKEEEEEEEGWGTVIKMEQQDEWTEWKALAEAGRLAPAIRHTQSPRPLICGCQRQARTLQ